MSVRRRPLAAAALVALTVVVSGCGSPNDTTSTTAPTAAGSTSSSSSPSTSTDPETALQTQLRATCAAGAAFETALSAFIDNGTGDATAALLTPATESFQEAQKALKTASGSGVDQVAQSVEKYLVAIESLTVLYAKGETAYQVPKNAGRDADVLRADAADLWDAGVAELFDNDPPSAPDDFLRKCGVRSP